MGRRVTTATLIAAGVPEGNLVITQSSLKAFHHCRRCWYLGHYLQLVKRDDYGSATNIGNLVHDALADYYAGGVHPVNTVRDTAVAMIDEAASPTRAKDIANDAELAGIMVEGYLEWLTETGADYELEFVEPEATMWAELYPGVILLGKLDGRVKTRDGERRFLEHKTVSNFADLPRFAPTEPQYLTYDLLERLWLLAHPGEGTRTDGCYLNMLRKVKRTAKATPPFYERQDIRHNDEELRNHFRHVTSTAREMQRVIAALNAGVSYHDACPPSPPTRECLYMCSFTELCVSGIMDDGSDWRPMADALFEPGDTFARYATTTGAES